MVRWTQKFEIDFGMLNDQHKSGEFKVDYAFWQEYVKLRYMFEQKHRVLLNRIKNKPKYKKLLRTCERESPPSLVVG